MKFKKAGHNPSLWVYLCMGKISKFDIENSSQKLYLRDEKNEVGGNTLQSFSFRGCSIENFLGKRQF